MSVRAIVEKLNSKCEARKINLTQQMVDFMKNNHLEQISFVDTPDGINHDPGLYFDDEVDSLMPDGDSDEFDEFWDNLVAATFDALRVLHTQHPYKRLDGTFYLKENDLKFVSSEAWY